MKKIFITLLVSFFAFVGFAQLTTAQVADVFAEIGVDNMTVSQTSFDGGDVAKISFDLWNYSKTDSPETYYETSLIELDKLDNPIAEYGKITSQKIFLSPQEIKHIDFDYQIPNKIGVGEKYLLKIQSYSGNSFKSGWNEKKVSVKGVTLPVDLKSVFVVINGEEKFNTQDGPVLKNDEKLSVALTLSNRSKETLNAKAILNFVQRNKDVKFSQEKDIKIESGEKEYNISINTTDLTEGVYVADIKLINESGEVLSSDAQVRFIIGGGFITISSVNVDKDRLLAGDNFNVSVSILGTPGDIRGLTNDIVSDIDLSVEVKNENGKVIAEETKKHSIAESKTVFNFDAKEDAQNIFVDVKAIKDGKVIASKQSNFTNPASPVLPTKKDYKMLLLVLLILGIILFVGLVIFLVKRFYKENQTSGYIGIFLLIVIVGGTFFADKMRIEAIGALPTNTSSNDSVTCTGVENNGVVTWTISNSGGSSLFLTSLGGGTLLNKTTNRVEIRYTSLGERTAAGYIDMSRYVRPTFSCSLASPYTPLITSFENYFSCESKIESLLNEAGNNPDFYETYTDGDTKDNPMGDVNVIFSQPILSKGYISGGIFDIGYGAEIAQCGNKYSNWELNALSKSGTLSVFDESKRVANAIASSTILTLNGISGFGLVIPQDPFYVAVCASADQFQQGSDEYLGSSYQTKIRFYDPLVTATCAPAQQQAEPGTPAAWTLTTDPKSGTFYYKWMSDSLATTSSAVGGTSHSANFIYTTITDRVKTASVLISTGPNGTGQTKTVSCSGSINVSDTALTASCTPNKTSVALSDPDSAITWTASASGGNGLFGYSWSGTDGLSGSSSSVTQRKYITTGTKTASVTITSGQDTITVACSSGVSVTDCPPGQVKNPITGVCAVSEGFCPDGSVKPANGICDVCSGPNCPDNDNDPDNDPNPDGDGEGDPGEGGPGTGGNFENKGGLDFKVIPAIVDKGQDCVLQIKATTSLACLISGGNFSKSFTANGGLQNFEHQNVSTTTKYTATCTDAINSVQYSGTSVCTVNPDLKEF